MDLEEYLRNIIYYLTINHCKLSNLHWAAIVCQFRRTKLTDRIFEHLPFIALVTLTVTTIFFNLIFLIETK